MFTRLLVGVDGSAGADSALALASNLTHRFGGSVVLAAVTDIHVMEGPLMESVGEFWTGALPAAPVAAQLGEYLHERAARHLEAAERRLEAAGVKSESVRAVGRVEDELVNLADHADALVVGRRGEAHDQPGAIGAVTHHLIKRYPKPVLVAGEIESECLRPVVAFDGLDTSTRALELAARYAGAVGATLAVLHVTGDRPEGEALLARAGAYLSAQGVSYETSLLEGPVAKAVADHIQRGGYDLLVAGAHSARRRSWSVGSHTEQLLKATAVPVLVHK
jgi:nucleotide-binding universal stress UspA family protein